jgi:hypothetical protein
MFARLIRFEDVSDADWEVGGGWFQQDYVPTALATEGFDGAYLLVDHEQGCVLTLTLWTSEDALNASQKAVDYFLAQTDAGRAATVETYAVEAAHIPTRAGR